MSEPAAHARHNRTGSHKSACWRHQLLPEEPKGHPANIRMAGREANRLSEAEGLPSAG